MFDTTQFSLVPGIEPVDGWQLLAYDYEDGDRFHSRGYTAHRFGEFKQLNTSRFFFTPSQERFAWIVENGFPAGMMFRDLRGPLCDSSIDMALAGKPMQVAA